MRIFEYQSLLLDGNLALSLAPALTPLGTDNHPTFFKGFATYPQEFARGLLVLADITSSRYFNYTPVSMRDPILSAQGDRLRAECFSACNGVYARLDLLQSGFDGDISLGTTNVDIGQQLRTALSQVNRNDKLYVSVGSDGFTASHIKNIDKKRINLAGIMHEKPVQMPDRWIRALGNAAEIHSNMKPVFTLRGMQAQSFLASLPPITGKNQSGWVTPLRAGVKLMPRPTPRTAYISGLHRLSALKRIMTNVVEMTFYMGDEPGDSMVVVDLSFCRLSLSLTAKAWQGYSGEGALLSSIAKEEVLDNAELISSNLCFDATINEMKMAEKYNLNKDQIQTALALLAVSGKLGYDAYDNTFFHRELPDDPNRVLKDNPRLIGAQKLIDSVENIGKNIWVVHSNESDYRVLYNPALGAEKAKCTCTWYINHQNRRGPCKHILAVQLKQGIL